MGPKSFRIEMQIGDSVAVLEIVRNVPDVRKDPLDQSDLTLHRKVLYPEDCARTRGIKGYAIDDATNS